VQDTFARQKNLPTALIQNKKGRFVDASLAEANKAFEGVRFANDFNTVNANDPDDGYPIVGVTWLLVKKEYENSQKAEAVKKMAQWILTKGQSLNAQLEYTRIPQSVAQKAMSAVMSNVAAR